MVKKVGILGYGEVGQAIAKFYKNPLIKDIKRDDGLVNLDVLHVCIPWSEKFIKTVKQTIASASPKLTVIHSTVPPGTTKRIGGMAVHSPIRGIHPYLHKGVKTFVKYVGADNKKAGLLAQKHLTSLGIKTKLFPSSATTELGKLLDTTYYGLIIAWHGEKKKLCDQFGVSFDNAVTDFNRTYNEGYKKFNMHHVVRPVLYAPGPHIGGHCIIPNAKILKQHFDSKAIDLILDYEKRIYPVKSASQGESASRNAGQFNRVKES